MTEITKELVLKELDALKEIVQLPNLFIANYFEYLRNDVDKQIATKLIQLEENEKEKKNELNQKWKKIIDKINSFEKTCNKNKINLEPNRKQIDSIETMLNDENLEEIKLAIESEETSLLKCLFQNKTIVYTDVNYLWVWRRGMKEKSLIIINDVFIRKKAFTKR